MESININNKAINGDLSVSRKITAGKDLTVRGNSQFDHNVVIKGWLDAENIKGPCKGLYASVEDLDDAYPNPQPGWYALVGDTLPADVYRCENGVWTATGEKGGKENLYLDELENDVKDIQDAIEEFSWLYDGGRADTIYGSAARVINCGNANNE